MNAYTLKTSLRTLILLAAITLVAQGAAAADETAASQGLHRLAVQSTALTLAVGTTVAARVHTLVRRESAPRQGFFAVGLRPIDQAALVGVFDSQNEGSAVGAGEQPIGQRSPKRSRVEWPGGGGCKAYSNGSHGPQR